MYAGARAARTFSDANFARFGGGGRVKANGQPRMICSLTPSCTTIVQPTLLFVTIKSYEYLVHKGIPEAYTLKSN